MNTPDPRDPHRLRLAENAAKVAKTLGHMARNAANLAMTPAEIAALHYAHETMRDVFGEPKEDAP